MSETGRVGCCSGCGGSGNGSYWDSAGCWDCRGSGHPHPEDQACDPEWQAALVAPRFEVQPDGRVFTWQSGDVAPTIWANGMRVQP